jgi:hypothetical protein
MDSGSLNPLQPDSPQPCSPSINNSDPLVQNPVEQCPPLVNQHAPISSPSTRYYEFAIGIRVFPVDVPSGYLILFLDKEYTLRDFTYAVIVDQQLQTKLTIFSSTFDMTKVSCLERASTKLPIC